jgi:membrane associated rhomboid family serine protease
MAISDHDHKKPIFEDIELKYRDGLRGFGALLSPSASTDPRDESFIDTLYNNLCPQLTFYSFSVFASIAYAIIFALQLVLSGVEYRGEFLEVNKTSLTSIFLLFHGGVTGSKQIWRIFTCNLVHSSLPSLVNVCILLIIWVSFLERIFGVYRTLIIFALTSVAGNAFGVLFAASGEVIMGGSVGIFGLLGASLGFMLYNWKTIQNKRFSRLYLFWMITFIVVFSMLMCGSATMIILQLGGVLSGIACGMFVSPSEAKDDPKNSESKAHEGLIRIIGAAFYACFLGISLCLIVISH